MNINIKDLLIERLEEKGLNPSDFKDILDMIKQPKYGLVWENHPEYIEEYLKNNSLVLHEKENLCIDFGYGYTNNTLIEGDNLASLLAMRESGEKVDVIYIDPPYNTGNEFVYNDKIVDKKDSFKHSKWLSFMEKRLKVARDLLTDEGVIFVSIDDNEQAQLKLLCDEVFGSDNFVSVLPTIMNLKGNQDEFGFAGTHEYTIVYAKNKNVADIKQFSITDESEIKEQGWLKDEKGYYKKGATLKRTGVDAPRKRRPTTYYPILIKDNEISMITFEEYQKIYNKDTKEFDDAHVDYLISKYTSQGFEVLLPETNFVKTSWRWQYSKVRDEKYEIIITNGRNGKNLYKKQRPQTGKYPTRKAKTLFYKPEYSSGNGTKEVEKLFGKKVFNNPKPIELIKDFLLLTTTSSSIILDFFAGSGTTGHAVLELNKEDGGHRQFILCTNNENNICRDVTYERLRRVINGYTTPKGKEVEGLPANLMYLTIDEIPKENNGAKK